jgi:hypothetical protein
MTLLEIAQYLAPPGSFLNKGAYEGAEQIRYVGARVRASGTFSFVTGPMSFSPLAAAFIFYGFVNEKLAEKWLLWTAAFALVLSIPVVGSRTVVYELGAVVVCAVVAAMCGVSQLLQSIKVAVPLLIISFLVTLLPLFSQASVNLRERFAQGSHAEGSLTQAAKERAFGAIISGVEQTDFFSNTFGVGMGSGAAAISKLTQGMVLFLAGEGEFGRALYELGPFPGLFFMIFRFLLAAFVAAMAIGRARNHDPLALLLVPLMFNSLFFCVLEQPTEQGFMVIGLAFSLAAIRKSEVFRFRVPQVATARFSAPRISQRAR